MNPTTYDTIQAHLTDLRRDAAKQRHPAPARPATTPNRPILTFTHTVEIDRPVTDGWALDTGHPPALQRLAGHRIRDGIMINLTKLKELLEAGSTVLPRRPSRQRRS